MRLAENPANPFVRTHTLWLEDAPPATRTVQEESARSILSTNDSPDIPFAWSANPYRGCQHACAYCYARRTHEYLELGAGTDFDTRIFVKVNAPELLAEELSRRSWRREMIAFSGVTDCYQPLEARYRLTRRCLEVCVRHANPASVVTKSYLVTRDIDLLVELQRRAHAAVHVSIAFADDAVARRMDAGAPPPSLRFEAVRLLAAAGLSVGVMIAPVIPGLNDRDIPTLLTRAANAGAKHVAYTPVRLPGDVVEVFLTRLRRELPDAAARVEARIRDLRGGALNDARFGCRMTGQGAYWESVQRLFETWSNRLGLDGGQPWRQRGCTPITPAGGKQLGLFD